MSRENRILPLKRESIRQILIKALFGEDATEGTKEVIDELNLIFIPDLSQIVVEYATSIPQETSATITRAIDDHRYLNHKEQKLFEEKLIQVYYHLPRQQYSRYNSDKNNEQNYLNLTKAFGALIAGRTEIYINKEKLNTKSYILDMLSKPMWSTKTNPDVLQNFTDQFESNCDSCSYNILKNFMALPASDIDYYLARKLLHDLDYEFKLSRPEVSALCRILDSDETNFEKQIAEILKTLKIDFVPVKSFSHEISSIFRFLRYDNEPLPLEMSISDKNQIVVIEKRNSNCSESRSKITEAKVYLHNSKDKFSYRISLNNANKIRNLFDDLFSAEVATRSGNKNFEEIKRLCGYDPLEPTHDGGCQLILSLANANRLANAYENRYFLTLLYRFINQTERELKTGAQRIVLSDTTKVKKQNSIVQAQILIEFFLLLSSNNPNQRDLLIAEIKTLCRSYLTNKTMGEKNFDVILDKLLSELQNLSKVQPEQRISLMTIAQALEMEIVNALQPTS